MKILLAVTDTEMGGVTTAAVNFSNELSRRGHEVFFLDMSGENKCADRLDDAINLAALDGRSRYWNLGSAQLKNARGLKKLLLGALGAMKKITIRLGLWHTLIFEKYKKYGSFDVAIAYRQCAPCYSFVLEKVKAKRKLGFVHGEFKYMGDISSWQRYMKRLDRVCYVSGAVKDEFCAAYPELAKNAAVVYNMFDHERMRELARESSDLLFDKEKVNIVTVSRVENDFKRIHLIPEICKILKGKTKSPFAWYIVGDGPDIDEDKLISESCGTTDVLFFVGKRENPFAILKSADVSVLTSKSEAYPMTVIESLILEIPVIVARFAAATEMIEDGRTGLITEQNVDDIAEKLLNVIENRNEILDRLKGFCKNNKVTNEKAYGQFLSALGN